MNITEETDDHTIVTFKDIRVGSTYVVDGLLYLKVEPERALAYALVQGGVVEQPRPSQLLGLTDDWGVAVNLATGLLTRVTSTKAVVAAHAEVVHRVPPCDFYIRPTPEEA